MSVELRAEVKSVSVKRKEEKQPGDDFPTVRRIGSLTLEFDADDVNADRIVELIAERPVFLVMADEQVKMPV